MLQTFDEFQCTGGASGWDGWDNYIGSHERDDWLIVIGRNRDSEVLTNSNFEVALEMLGGEQEDSVEVHSFGHWACGWFELILINPQHNEIKQIAENIRKSLEDYPVLDEIDFSKKEMKAFEEDWECWGASEFAKAICHTFDLEYPADEVIENSPVLSEFFNQHSCYGFNELSADIDQIVQGMTIDDLNELAEYRLPELRRDAYREALLKGIDPFDESLRWRWDNQIRFPWESYLVGE